ncbi:hypothetical protein MIMGU_mgv1a009904mg [Erythranthe guttata]|uniref:Uncharacterized protein n=1 Tax=Erythranthe guttata TaxID=4155 RepID=A0A022RVN4_ERYGU|nr:PREDICTED: chlorophyllase-1-like [Erythranthe guttata]EYU43828.1 hypothetical protein MIMGU_mgv1a009904mg [Erythranthe guttata]|eukprot:XP_012828577.1 PREDICTED: chlorophyllase-1-like [Erythranthe guttata]
MTTSAAEIATASSDVFETGNYEVTDINVGSGDATKPPTDLFIVSPVTKGTYPVLLFCHGFYIPNTCYTTLLHHIASHGYIVVAPKFYGLIIISIAKGVNKASLVTEWLSTGLSSVLPENVNGDLENLALSGHSRGGKTAFALALASTAPPQKFKAVIGIDPVAGSGPSMRSAPKILEYIPRSFGITTPVAVVGTGYGNQRLGLIPPFAPNGVNHSEFFNESKPPVCYFLAKDYGHCDMLDDWIAKLASFVCKSGGGDRDLMRRGVGGIVVAFLRCYLGGDGDLNGIVGDPSVAPITFDPVIYVKEQKKKKITIWCYVIVLKDVVLTTL